MAMLSKPNATWSTLGGIGRGDGRSDFASLGNPILGWASRLQQPGKVQTGHGQTFFSISPVCTCVGQINRIWSATFELWRAYHWFGRR